MVVKVKIVDGWALHDGADRITAQKVTKDDIDNLREEEGDDPEFDILHVYAELNKPDLGTFNGNPMFTLHYALIHLYRGDKVERILSELPVYILNNEGKTIEVIK